MCEKLQTNNSVLIYRINETHLNILVEIAIQTFDETFASSNKAEDMQNYNERCFTVEQFGKEMKSKDSWFYFAEFKGELAGYLKVNAGNAQTEMKEEEGFEIERIYVLKKFHGTGIGAELMKKAIQKGTKLKKKYLWMGVHEENFRALRFYQKFGLEAFDEHIFMMGMTPQRDVLMKMELGM